MRTRNYLYVIAMTGLIAAGCTSAVYIQKDDSVDMGNYRTYMWVDTKASETDNTVRASAYADISVRNAANAELRKTGWREVSENPDVLISYDVLVERDQQQRSDPVYSQPVTRSYFNPYTRRWGTVYYPSQFIGYQDYTGLVKEGTVTITMVDARTDKGVWQGWTTDEMNYSRMTDDEIARSVHNIFNKFDIASR